MTDHPATPSPRPLIALALLLLGTRGVPAYDDMPTATGELVVWIGGQPHEPGQRLWRPARVPDTRVAGVLKLLAGEPGWAAAPAVAANPFAGGVLTAATPEGRPGRLTLRRNHLDVHVEGGFARTTVDQTWFNYEPERLEGTLHFPLPPDASINRLAMYVDGRRMEGAMLDRDDADAIYEEIAHGRRRDPALLEWIDGRTFRLRVFPLEPRQEKRIVLSYVQKLPTPDARPRYAFPAATGLGKIPAWSFHVRIKDAAGQDWQCPSHPAPAHADGADLVLTAEHRDAALDRDLILLGPRETAQEEASVRFATAVHDGFRYLLVRYRPRLDPAAPPARRDWVFLVEATAGRDPSAARAQIEAVRQLLAAAAPDDTFAVVAAGTVTQALAAQPLPVTPANVQAAVAFLEGLPLVGALDLEAGLRAAAVFLAAGKQPCLVHVGGGTPALGDLRPEPLAALIPAGTAFAGLLVGPDGPGPQLVALASRTGGTFRPLLPDESLPNQVAELRQALAAPRLVGPTVTDAAGHAYRPFAHLVGPGEEVAAVARLDAAEPLPAAVTVSGTAAGQQIRHTFPVRQVTEKADYLPRAWARLEIARLLAERRGEYQGEVAALGKATYVLTPFTSLLVLENEAMYQQYKVEMGRKDHWAAYPCPDKIPVVTEPLPADGPARPTARRPADEVLQSIVVRVPPTLLAWPNRRDGAFGGPEPWPFVTAWAMANDAIALPAGGVLDAPGGPDLRRTRPQPGLGDRPRPADDAPFRGRPRLDNGRRALPGGFGGGGFGGGGGLGGAGFPGQPGFAGGWANADGWAPRPPPRAQGADPRALRLWDVSAPFAQWKPRLHPDWIGPQFTRGPQWQRLEVLVTTVPHFRDVTTVTRGVLEPPPQDGQPPRVEGPRLQIESNLFSNLLAFAPGLNTHAADILAVVEAEALPDPAAAPGPVAPAARALIDRARNGGWESVRLRVDDALPPPAGPRRRAGARGPANPSYLVTYDGRGRFALRRFTLTGLEEAIVCDGRTRLHLYPELGLGARRAVSRFHHAEINELVPWLVPTAEDLARGAAVQALDAATVAVVPADPSRPAMHLVFTPEGPLAERRLVERPTGRVLARETYAADGTVRLLDAAGRVTDLRHYARRPAAGPDLQPDLRPLVILPLPFRTAAELVRSGRLPADDSWFNLPPESRGQVPEELILALLCSDRPRERALSEWFSEVEVRRRGQSQVGLMTLAVLHHTNVLFEFSAADRRSPVYPFYLLFASDERAPMPPARYRPGSLLGYLRDAWKRHQARLPVPDARFAGWGASLLRWAVTRADGPEVAPLTDALAGTVARQYPAIAGLDYAWRYASPGKGKPGDPLAPWGHRRARLYLAMLTQGIFPPADREMATWNGFVDEAEAIILKRFRRGDLFLLARQRLALRDEPGARRIARFALDEVPPAERLDATLAAIAYYWDIGEADEAEQLVRDLLADADLARRADVWRLAATVARGLGQTHQFLAYLEQAVDREWQNLPAVVDLRVARQDLETLLAGYADQARAVGAVRAAVPAELPAKVVRALSRWRALAPEEAEPLETVARIFRHLGDRETAWLLLMTRYAGGGSKTPLARVLEDERDYGLAARCWAAEFANNPADPEPLLWQADLLLKAGRRAEAGKLLRQVAEGTWPGDNDGVRAEARKRLDRLGR